MADHRFNLSPAAAVALVSATAKTVMKVTAPANIRVKCRAWGVSFDGASPTAVPVLVELLRISGGTFTSLTPLKADDSLAETIQSTAGSNASVEPTPGDVLKKLLVHPQGRYEWSAPYGSEHRVGGGDSLAIRCTALAGVNVMPWMECEE